MSFKLNIFSAVVLLAAGTSAGCGESPPDVIVSTDGWVNSLSELSILPVVANKQGRAIRLNKNEKKFGFHLPDNFIGQLDITIGSWESDMCLDVTGGTSILIDVNSQMPLHIALPLIIYKCTAV